MARLIGWDPKAMNGIGLGQREIATTNEGDTPTA
jgi:hypothetical protein